MIILLLVGIVGGVAIFVLTLKFGIILALAAASIGASTLTAVAAVFIATRRAASLRAGQPPGAALDRHPPEPSSLAQKAASR